MENFKFDGSDDKFKDSIRDDSVPSSINLQKNKRRVVRPRKGEMIVTKKVQFKKPILVQPSLIFYKDF